jgi:hypothetical protein
MSLSPQQEAVYSTLRSLAGQDRYFIIPRILVSLCGGWEEAGMMNQILRWSNPTRNLGWFYKSNPEFALELFLSEGQVRRCRANLKELGYIETKVVRVQNSPHTWYRPIPTVLVDKYQKHLSIPAGAPVENDRSPVENAKSSIHQNSSSKYITQKKDGLVDNSPPPAVGRMFQELFKDLEEAQKEERGVE